MLKALQRPIPYTIWDQNSQNRYPISDQNVYQPTPFGAAHTYGLELLITRLSPLICRAWRCDIKGAPSGKLRGKTVAIKDNVCVAGVPLMNGSRILEGFVPDIDATVVSRILDAGGQITGKTVCENMCCDGGSFTSVTGPVLNPHDNTRMANGSSSGSAALVSFWADIQIQDTVFVT